MGWAGQFADLALHEEEDEIESCLVNLSQNKPCESRKKSRSKQTETRLLSKLARVKVGRDNNLVGRQVNFYWKININQKKIANDKTTSGGGQIQNSGMQVSWTLWFMHEENMLEWVTVNGSN